MGRKEIEREWSAASIRPRKVQRERPSHHPRKKESAAGKAPLSTALPAHLSAQADTVRR